jgi:predicted transcriptional regulator
MDPVMISVYQSTQKGRQTREKILEILQEQDGLSRDEICDRGLTYAQVRRQVKELVSAGTLRSSTESFGKKRYFMVFTIALSLGCSIPLIKVSEDPHGNSYIDRVLNFGHRSSAT